MRVTNTHTQLSVFLLTPAASQHASPQVVTEEMIFGKCGALVFVIDAQVK
jgi:hypothetical protein